MNEKKHEKRLIKTPRQQGFTLIELIVVVFLIGLMASLASLNFNRNLDSVAHGEAKRYSRVLNYIKEYSAYSGRVLSFRLSKPKHTYYFLYVDPLTRSWSRLDNKKSANKLLSPHVIDERVKLELINSAASASKFELASGSDSDESKNKYKSNNLEIALVSPFSDYEPAILRFTGESKHYSIVTTQDDEVKIEIQNF